MVMKKTNPWSTKRLALYSLALAFLSWGWALLPGAGTLTSACRKLPLAERRPLYSAAGIPVVSESCATTLSWTWFLIVYQFGAIVLGTMAASGTAAGCLKPGAMVQLTIITTLLFQAAKTFIDLRYLALDAGANATVIAANTAFAGALLSIIFNTAACTLLGWTRVTYATATGEAAAVEEAAAEDTGTNDTIPAAKGGKAAKSAVDINATPAV